MKSILENHIPSLKEKLAIDLSVFDPAFLERTITARMASESIKSADLYLSNLQENKEEQAELARNLSNSYSEFFRNPLTFAYLEQIILPGLLEKRRISREKKIRIWSAACASGQEAYSLSILCDELSQNKPKETQCLIFATDHNESELTKAQVGDYTSATLGKVSLNRIQTYFIQKEETYSVIPRLKEIINFSVFDLISGEGTCPPASIYGNFDLIFCSNLLFYYKPVYRNRILDKLGNSLANGGYLITSETEREIAKGNNYREVFANSAIFQKKAMGNGQWAIDIG